MTVSTGPLGWFVPMAKVPTPEMVAGGDVHHARRPGGGRDDDLGAPSTRAQGRGPPTQSDRDEGDHQRHRLAHDSDGCLGSARAAMGFASQRARAKAMTPPAVQWVHQPSTGSRRAPQ